jgi:YbgC/YbaW family acyl-CoA thioester hydrolase
MAQREDFPFIHRLRVRWQEVDAQKVVFNGHYLSYLDVAMSEYWRAVGLPYPEGMTHHGGDMYARQHTLAYHAPAVLDDLLDIGVRCDHIGNSSMKLAWAVWSDHRLLVTGEVIYVHTSLATRRPEPVPSSVRAQIQAQAEGRPVTQLRLGRWDELGSAARDVRTVVFIGEQNIPAHEEWDADDAQALHAVVLNGAGLALATGRLITLGQAAGQARIGRMAVLRSMRGSGIGRQILQALVDAARAQDVRTVILHAQTSARRFYESLGFTADGDAFDEVGIPHIAMRLDLRP